jgi:hypothetical protein
LLYFVTKLGDKKPLLRKTYPISSDVLDSHTMKKNNSRVLRSHTKEFETFHYTLFKNRWKLKACTRDGQFDTFMNALAKIYKSKSYPN